MDDVTIIIPVYGEQEQEMRALNASVESIHETYPDVITLFALNGSRSGEILLERIVGNGTNRVFSGSERYCLNVRQGQCMAVNAAAAIVNTKWIFITNDDMIYAPGWLEKLVNTAESHKLKFLCPNLVEPHKGAPPFLAAPCGGAGGDFNKAAWLEFAQKHVDNTLEEGFNFPILIDREVWQRIGGYDINYDPWGSNGDSDLQAKLILAGLETFRDRNVIVYHFSQTSGTFEPQNASFWQKNYAYFTKKWGFDRQPTDKVWYSHDIIDYSKLIYKPEWMGRLGKDVVASMMKFNSYVYTRKD